MIMKCPLILIMNKFLYFQGREPATYIRTMVGKIGCGIAIAYAVVYYFKYNANVSELTMELQKIALI